MSIKVKTVVDYDNKVLHVMLKQIISGYDFDWEEITTMTTPNTAGKVFRIGSDVVTLAEILSKTSESDQEAAMWFWHDIEEPKTQ